MSVRIATEADVPAILAIYAPYVENTTYTFEYTVPSVEEFLQRFRSITERFPWLVWEENGRIQGFVYGSAPFARVAYHWCAEASIYLAPEIQGRGVGRLLYTALEQLLTAQGFRVVYGLITSENSGSIAFHQALGYVQIGRFPQSGYKFGRWLDVTWVEKRLQEVGNPSDFPAKWPDFVKSTRNVSTILDILTLS